MRQQKSNEIPRKTLALGKIACYNRLREKIHESRRAVMRLIPKPSLARLPLYYRCLREALRQNISYLSSSELGERCGVPAVQVRKDLSYLSQKGRSGVGYNVADLAAHLESYLGLANEKDAALVGVGNLGRALALYPGFATYGLQIVTLFDSNPVHVGSEVGGRTVFAVDRLTNLVKRLGIRIGIIATPAGVAQAVAEDMVAGDIKAIWNFAPVRLDLPEDVFVKQEDLAASLAVLSHHIQQLKVAPLYDEVESKGSVASG
jgi:redox-sensing transcriptional repressor